MIGWLLWVSRTKGVGDMDLWWSYFLLLYDHRYKQKRCFDR